MTDDSLFWTAKPPAPRKPNPGEPLFSFRTAGHRQVDCELRFQGESYGWDVQFFVDGTFSRSHRWPTREGAIQWAEAQRRAVEGLAKEWWPSS